MFCALFAHLTPDVPLAPLPSSLSAIIAMLMPCRRCRHRFFAAGCRHFRHDTPFRCHAIFAIAYAAIAARRPPLFSSRLPLIRRAALQHGAVRMPRSSAIILTPDIIAYRRGAAPDVMRRGASANVAHFSVPRHRSAAAPVVRARC